jgi:transposase
MELRMAVQAGYAPESQRAPERPMPACNNKDPELFFDSARVDRAKAVCATCPVMQECRTANWQETHGVFGGMTAEERKEQGGALGYPSTDVEETDEPVVKRETVNHVKLEELYNRGESYPYIADKLGVSPSTVCRHVIALNLTRDVEAVIAARKAKYRNPEREQEIIRLYKDEYMGVQSIATKMKCSKRTIYEIVSDYELHRDPKLVARRAIGVGRARARTDKQTLEIVAHLKEDKLSVKEIAEMMDVSVHRVYGLRKSVQKGVY